MFPSKRFSQNFLINSEIASKIVLELNICDSDTVIEVGPGKGVLTNLIIQKTKNAYFVELDRELCKLLEKRFKLDNKLMNTDILKLDLRKLANGRKLKIIGNFPYNISGKLILKFYENRDVVDEVVGMLQKEVVDRLCAGPGTKKYGIPAIFTQCYYDVTELFNVDPTNFIPKPKVMSCVFRLKRNDIDKLNCDEDLFRKIVKLCFSCRRKIISNNLRYNEYFKYIDYKYQQKRAEKLTINDFINITNSIKANIDNLITNNQLD